MQLVSVVFDLLICVLFVFRLSRYQQFKDFQRRILVATNLFGRGMDIERVNIVFNYDMPEDSDTYLHRVRLLFIYGRDGTWKMNWNKTIALSIRLQSHS